MQTNILKSFPRTFWIANTLELFERWAWYGFFMLFANYLTQPTDLGGLEFTQAEKGSIMGIGTAILYFLPILTGSIADKYGYKKIMTLAFVIYISGFILLPMFDSYTGVFLMYIYLAFGGALFKPIVSATVAKTTNASNASIGFGLFYMMVNLGAFLGPMLSLLYRSNVFYISAGMVVLNFVLLLFYKEPDRTPQNENISDTIRQIFKNIWLVMSDFKFVIFLLIISGFWTMYYQLFFTLPVFVAQWVDTSGMYRFFAEYIPFIAQWYGTDGQMEAEFVTSFDALFIVFFQIGVSALVMRLKPLSSMVSGIVVSSIGMALTLMTQNVTYTILAMLIFSLGEMAASPKITEYIGKIAPPDKKALYMGYSFIPLFLGSFFAGFISGNVYQQMSDKYQLAFNLAQEKQITLPEDLSLSEKFDAIANHLNLSHQSLTQYLWEHQAPSSIWMVILGIGLFSAFCLWIYNRLLKN